jgi:hypothetical protein
MSFQKEHPRQAASATVSLSERRLPVDEKLEYFDCNWLEAGIEAWAAPAAVGGESTAALSGGGT